MDKKAKAEAKRAKRVERKRLADLPEPVVQSPSVESDDADSPENPSQVTS